MIYTFSNNIWDKISCAIYNKREKYTQKIWVKKPHYVFCKICRTELHSHNYFYKLKNKYSPEQMGWKYIKSKDGINGWICHSCLEHHDTMFISKEKFLSYFKLETDVKDEIIQIKNSVSIKKIPIYINKNINVDVDGLADLALDMCNIKDKEEWIPTWGVKKV